MLQHPCPEFQIGSTPRHLTSLPGAAFFIKSAQKLGALDGVALPQSQGPATVYHPHTFPLTLGSLLACGGEALDDVEALRRDPALLRLLGVSRLPAANSLGNWLRSLGVAGARKLEQAAGRLTRNEVRRRRLRRIILDPDATLIERWKQGCAKTYEGFRGYAPMVVGEAETGMVWYTEFREGNDVPQARALEVLDTSLARVPKKLQVWLRADSAWYQAAVLDRCQEQGVTFTITADQDSAVRSACAGIPEAQWQPWIRDKRREEVARTVHTLNDCQYAYTLAVIRWKEEQEGQTELLWRYHAVITNHPGTVKQILAFHRQRGTDEHVNARLKNDLAGKQLPCGTFAANAAYWALVCWTYNVLVAAKAGLPDSWASLELKALRFRILRAAGLVVRTGRRVVLKLEEHWPWRQEIEGWWRWCGQP